ncbi:MAG: protein kinase domain-containing protein [Sulfurifustis sp.]
MRLLLDIGHSERSSKPTALLGRCVAVMPARTSEPGQGVMLICAQGIAEGPDPVQAARAAVEVMEDVYTTATLTATLRETLTDGVTAANHAVRASGDRGRAAALAAVVLHGTRWYLAHAGHVRAWRARDQHLKQLTRDHVLPRALGRREVTKACGYAESIDADFDEGEIEEGDIFLITSPGVHDMLSGAELLGALQSESSAQQMAEALVARAATGNAWGYLGVCVARIDKLLDKSEAQTAKSLPLIPLPAVGAEIDGFVIEKQLAKNARFRLYKARDSRSEETVVLRFPDPSYPDSAQIFLREEAASRRVESPYLLKPIVLAGRVPTALYAAAEYRKCESLAKRIRRKQGLGLKEGLRLGEQLLALLETLHAHGIIHGDLRPQNLLYDKRRRQIYALGPTVNRQISSRADERRLPSGSRSYRAPELLRDPVVAERSDIFAAGVTMYRMFSGKYPYGKIRSPEDWTRREYVPLRRDGEVLPAALDHVLARACALDPADRYSNVAQFAIAFNAARVDATGAARATQNAANKPHAIAWWFAAALVCALLGYLYVALR